MRLRRLAPLALLLAAPLAGAAREDSAPADARTDNFLAEVELLISAEERAAYLELARPYQRKEFERRFWEVRDPYPQTPRNELAERWHARWELASSRYADRSDDRFKILLWNGEPGQVVRLRCPQLLRVGEAWIYARTEAIPSRFILVFLTGGVSESAPHRLWNARGGLRDAFSSSSGSFVAGANALTSEQVASECPRGQEILDLLAGAADWPELANHFPVAPRVHPEWLTTFKASSTDAPAGAESLAAEVEIRFSGRNQSRTIVDAAVLVEAEELARGQVAGGLVLDGDVLRGEELFEHFRYRYDLPSDRSAGRKVPFAARRFLRPGSYTLVLRLQETAGSRFYRVEVPLEVPTPAEVGGEPPAPEIAADPAGAAPSIAAADPATVPSATAGGEGTEPKLRLLAPIDRLVSGRLRVEAIIEGFVPRRVDFTLDGKPLFAKLRPPFSIDLELGRVPRLRRLAAVAYDADGAAVADDELVLNGGPHRFAVRIVEPERAPAAGARIEARARVDLPEGESLERLEFWLDEERLATLYGPPWAVALEAPRGRRVSYLRAVAYLDDGVAAEDLRLLAGAEDSLAVDVDFVELYTSVLDRRGRPVAGLAQAEVRILEDGAEQEIRRFEAVDDAPIHAGVMIDTSASMLEELADTRVAAERFVREILTPRDRAAVITFADSPRLAARFTNDIEVLAGGLASIGAEGETHLHDALAYALHYFSGVRGKRAIVVLSDFVDSGSRYRVDEILEYARRTGVAIYGIGLNVPREFPEAGMLLDRLTRETGGRSFRISRAKELGPVYDAIRAELRAQYLLAYQSSRADGSLAYREIEVEVRRPGAEARTLAGYYP